MRGHGRHRRLRVQALVLVAVVLVLLVGGYLIGRNLENDAVEPRAQMSEGFGQYKEWIHEDTKYYEKTGQTRLLVMGVDRDTSQPQSGYRDGGQADFLMVLVIDHDAREIRQLQIERDTMASFQTLGIFGDVMGRRVMQICLSHAYGRDQKACARNTLDAVSRYLDNLDIDLYMALNFDSVPIVNDMLGGVTVKLEDDFTFADPSMTKGSTVTLHGKLAETFVRSRMSVGDGTNASRQLRQRAWMSGAMDLFRSAIHDDASFGSKLIDALGDNMVSNVSQGRLVNELNRAWKYTVQPVEQIAGTYSIGDDGFVEYHTDPEDVANWVLDVCYRPAEQ
ncbi:MAG: LCP family protein [Clostridia bacterium]|nr:LCP family protein [Clostridia bacterium]